MSYVSRLLSELTLDSFLPGLTMRPNRDSEVVFPYLSSVVESRLGKWKQKQERQQSGSNSGGVTRGEPQHERTQQTKQKNWEDRTAAMAKQ